MSVRPAKTQISQGIICYSLKSTYTCQNELIGQVEKVGNMNGFHSRMPEIRHDKTNKMAVRPAKTQISQGIRPVWLESSLSAWRKLGFLATHWVHREDAGQSGRMPRLIWVFAGRTVIL